MRIRLSLHLIVLLGAFTIIGCGSSKSNNSATRGSTSPFPPTGGGGYTQRLGECNRVNMSNVGLTGQVGTYYSPQTQQLVTTFINLNIKSAPAALFTSDTIRIKFFRWTRSTTTKKVVNQVATKFYFADKLNGATSQPTLIDTISKANLQQVKTTLGSTWVNVPLDKIFDRVLVVLTGMDMQYDAIAVAYYDTAVSSSAVAVHDVLLPSFYANPNTYKTANPYPELYSIHPNYATINSNASENDYYQAIEAICYEMSGMGNRVPASEATMTSTLKPRNSADEGRSPELNSGPSDTAGDDGSNTSFWQTVWAVVISAIDAIGGR